MEIDPDRAVSVNLGVRIEEDFEIWIDRRLNKGFAGKGSFIRNSVAATADLDILST